MLKKLNKTAVILAILATFVLGLLGIVTFTSQTTSSVQAQGLSVIMTTTRTRTPKPTATRTKAPTLTRTKTLRPTVTRTKAPMLTRTKTKTPTKPKPTLTSTPTRTMTKTPTKTATPTSSPCDTVLGGTTVAATLTNSYYSGWLYLTFAYDTPVEQLPTKLCVMQYGSTTWEERTGDQLVWVGCAVNDSGLMMCLDTNFQNVQKAALTNNNVTYIYKTHDDFRYEAFAGGWRRTTTVVGANVGDQNVWIELPNLTVNQVLPKVWANGIAITASTSPDYDGQVVARWDISPTISRTVLSQIVIGSDTGFYSVVPAWYQRDNPPYTVSTVFVAGGNPQYRTIFTIQTPTPTPTKKPTSTVTPTATP